MPTFQDFYFPSSTGANQIHAHKCIPDGAPRAVIQIVHGIAEYIERYDDFMRFLADNRFVAVGNDHLGHGKSVQTPEDLGFFADEDGWNRVLDDMDTLRSMMHTEHPDLPYIFFGHSMGSFLTRSYIIKYPERYDAAILSGTGHQSKPLIMAGNLAAKAMVKFLGPRGDGTLLNNMAFGAYNNRIPVKMTDFDWVCSNYEVVNKYVADPMCGFVAKVSLYRDMMGGISFITDQSNIDRMSKTQPIYFFSGAEDPVGDYGKGVERAYSAFCSAGIKDVFMRLYPGGRHEMLNEMNNSQVYQDVLDWLNERLEKIG